jgi:hypothetical protein
MRFRTFFHGGDLSVVASACRRFAPSACRRFAPSACRRFAPSACRRFAPWRTIHTPSVRNHPTVSTTGLYKPYRGLPTPLRRRRHS